jgi:hypothetical protein
MTIEELQKRCVVNGQNAKLTAKLNWFMEQFRLSKHRQFGVSSERTAPEQQQLFLFNETEVEAQPVPAEPTVETITYQRRKQRGHRETVLENLPVETVEYRLPVEEQVCSCYGGPLHETSTEVRQELQIISYLFEKLPNLDTKDENAFDKLLPWSESLPLVCRGSK